MDIVRRWLQSRAEGSSDIAKERLRLVLVHNRVSLNSEQMVALRQEIVTVLSRYFEIDQDSLQLDVRRGERANQLVTTISVKNRS